MFKILLQWFLEKIKKNLRDFCEFSYFAYAVYLSHSKKIKKN